MLIMPLFSMTIVKIARTWNSNISQTFYWPLYSTSHLLLISSIKLVLLLPLKAEEIIAELVNHLVTWLMCNFASPKCCYSEVVLIFVDSLFPTKSNVGLVLPNFTAARFLTSFYSNSVWPYWHMTSTQCHPILLPWV